MSIFEKIIEDAVKASEENEALCKENGDYVKDGIVHCGKCKTPKQMPIPEEFVKFGMPQKLIRIPCKCEEARLDSSAEENRREQKRLAAEEMMSDLEEIGVTTSPTPTFAKSDKSGGRAERILRIYADKFDDILRDNLGIMLFGDLGCGKTFYAGCVANELIDKGYMVMFTSVRKIADAKKEDKAFVMRCVKACDLLILDDFGAERDTEFMAEQTFEIVNARYEAKKPLLVTTNMNPNAVAEEKDLTYARAFSRIMEMCRPVRVEGTCKRTAIATDKTDKWKSLLKSEWEKWG